MIPGFVWICLGAVPLLGILIGLSIKVRNLSRIVDQHERELVALLEQPLPVQTNERAPPLPAEPPVPAELPVVPKKLTTGDPMEDTFHDFYENNRWGNSESRSGSGSTFYYTAHLRRHLPSVLQGHGIQSMVDAPCGDFNWMKAVKFEQGFNYIGGDIVRKLVADNAAQYSSPSRSFMRLDVVTDEFPEVDMWFCRDLLFHLPNASVMNALKNFAGSRIKFAMITSHINNRTFKNKDIPGPGGFRLLDLQSRPYNFPPPLAEIQDYVEGFPPRNMCLWTREQIASALANTPAKGRAARV